MTGSLSGADDLLKSNGGVQRRAIHCVDDGGSVIAEVRLTARKTFRAGVLTKLVIVTR
jgi:hypothetical protein